VQRDPAGRVGRTKLIERREHLLEDADHGLRVIPPRDLGQNVVGDLDDLAAGGEGGLDGLLQHRVIGGVAGEHQHLGRAAQLHRLGDDLQALGDESAGLLALLPQVQGADGLHRRIGQGGDEPGHEDHLA
jgi:hypothetical protein